MLTLRMTGTSVHVAVLTTPGGAIYLTAADLLRLKYLVGAACSEVADQLTQERQNETHLRDPELPS